MANGPSDHLDTGTITITAEMPKQLLARYLQYIRDFEMKYFEQIELRIAIDANLPAEEAEKLLARISPPYAYRTTIKIPYPHSPRTPW
jgi:hypothetical protein